MARRQGRLEPSSLMHVLTAVVIVGWGCQTPAVRPSQVKSAVLPPAPLPHPAPEPAGPPPATGAQIQLVSDETAAERALQLAEKLREAETARDQLQKRVQELERIVADQYSALMLSDKEMQGAADDIARARQELIRLAEMVKTLQNELANKDKQYEETLKMIISLVREIFEAQQKEGQSHSETSGPQHPEQAKPETDSNEHSVPPWLRDPLAPRLKPQGSNAADRQRQLGLPIPGEGRPPAEMAPPAELDHLPERTRVPMPSVPKTSNQEAEKH